MRPLVVVCLVLGCRGSVPTRTAAGADARPPAADALVVPPVTDAAKHTWSAVRGWSEEKVLHEGDVTVLLGTFADESHEVIAVRAPGSEPLVLLPVEPNKGGEDTRWTATVGPFLGSPDFLEIQLNTHRIIFVENTFDKSEHTVVVLEGEGLKKVCSILGTRFSGTRAESTSAQVRITKVDDDPFTFEVLTTEFTSGSKRKLTTRYVLPRDGDCKPLP